jgi:hypothetical protein
MSPFVLYMNAWRRGDMLFILWLIAVVLPGGVSIFNR